MIRFGHHRRYSPERTWEPLSDTEWAVLSPFLFRAAEAEAEKRRDAALAAAQHPDAPPFRERRPAGRPVRDPRARLDAIFWLAANTRPWRAPPPWHALPRALRQARHRLPPVPPLGQAGPLDQAAPGAGRRRPPRHRRPPPPGKLDLPHVSPRLAPARRAGHGPRPPPRLPLGAARPLLAAARPGFVRTGLLQAPRRHAPRPRARVAGPPGRLSARLPAACCGIAAGRRCIPRCLAPP